MIDDELLCSCPICEATRNIGECKKTEADRLREYAGALEASLKWALDLVDEWVATGHYNVDALYDARRLLASKNVIPTGTKPEPEGKLTVTTNEAGECVAVTMTDDENRILKTFWERKERPEISTQSPDGMALMRAFVERIATYTGDAVMFQETYAKAVKRDAEEARAILVALDSSLQRSTSSDEAEVRLLGWSALDGPYDCMTWVGKDYNLKDAKADVREVLTALGLRPRT